MTVECGFGGQKFQEQVLQKVRDRWPKHTGATELQFRQSGLGTEQHSD